MSHQVWLPPPKVTARATANICAFYAARRKRPWGRNRPRASLLRVLLGCCHVTLLLTSYWPELARVATFSWGQEDGPGEAPGNVIPLLVVLCPTESQEFCYCGARGRWVTETVLGPCHVPWVWRATSQRPPLSPCPQLPRRLLPRGRSSSCP